MLPNAGRARWVLLGALVASVGLIAGCGGGGGGGGGSDDASDNDLVLVEFALVDSTGTPTGGTGTSNAYRNNRLMFTFSAPVDEDTVNDRTIQVGVPSGTNLFLTAPGTFETDGNRVYFDPTVTVTGQPRPFGLEANSTYSVSVFGVPDPKTIVSEKGKPVLSTFSTTFTTTDQYLPDFDQPRIESIAPAAQTSIPTNRFSSEARDIWVKSDADIVVKFSEAMNPATFDQLTTFMVMNTDRNREVLGTFRFSDDATEVTFRPTFGFGRGPYILSVSLSVGLTDLAGNAIANPQEWEFLTEFDESAVNEGLVEEYFDDTTFEDTAFTPTGAAGRASWNPASDPGKLASTFGNTSTTVPTTVGTNVTNVIPLGTGTFANMFCLVWYGSSDVGNAGTISGYKFRTGTGSTAPNAVMSGFTVKMGHNNLSGGLTTSNPRTANFNVGSPVTVINNVSYTLPASVPTNSPVAFPAFSQAFGYDGQSHLTVDISKTNTTGSQGWGVYSGWGGGVVSRCWGYPSTGTTSSGSSTNYCYQCVLDFRTESSMAQSLWYQTESDEPMYLDPIVLPTEQPVGTETAITYEGAHNDGDGNPDPTTYSGMVEDAADVTGYEFIRFQVSFKANLGTGMGPQLEEIVIPYLFF